jgi:hypothetical protein
MNDYNRWWDDNNISAQHMPHSVHFLSCDWTICEVYNVRENIDIIVFDETYSSIIVITL